MLVLVSSSSSHCLLSHSFKHFLSEGLVILSRSLIVSPVLSRYPRMVFAHGLFCIFKSSMATFLVRSFLPCTVPLRNCRFPSMILVFMSEAPTSPLRVQTGEYLGAGGYHPHLRNVSSTNNDVRAMPPISTNHSVGFFVSGPGPREQNDSGWESKICQCESTYLNFPWPVDTSIECDPVCHYVSAKSFLSC